MGRLSRAHSQMGHQHVQFIESMNKWMRDVRDASHTTLHAILVAKCMNRQFERRVIYESNTLLEFPTRTNGLLLQSMEGGGRKLHVCPGLDTWFLVDGKWDVNLSLDLRAESAKKLGVLLGLTVSDVFSDKVKILCLLRAILVRSSCPKVKVSQGRFLANAH